MRLFIQDSNFIEDMKLKQLIALSAFAFSGVAALAQLPFDADGGKVENAKIEADNLAANTDYVADSIPNRLAVPYTNTINKDDSTARKVKTGIYIVGHADSLRVLNGFGGNPNNYVVYANAVNQYQKRMGDSIRVYSMVIPIAAEFYTPDMAAEWTRSQRLAINSIYKHLNDSVTAVDVYTPLARHASERIYSRTDHHWSALGAFYAAERFAKLAKVPFKGLDNYEKSKINGYVGSMYYFTKLAEVKNSRDSFEIWKPKGVEYKTTYTNFIRNKNKQVIGEKAPYEGDYFIAYPDSSSGAYCTYGGGDEKIVKVETSANTGRRLMIIKDSFGNALSPYLFYGFDEILVCDFRFFKRNIVNFARENGITDVLIANNMAHACSPNTSVKLVKLLNQ